MSDRAAERRRQTVEKASGDARRRGRQEWPIRRFELGTEPSDDLSECTSANERLAMVWPLTLLSWRLAKRPLPVYDRSATPGRVVRSRAPD